MRLSKEEKKEILRFACSASLRRDLEQIESRRKMLSQKQYIAFLSFCNQLYGHKIDFHKIEGKLFKL